MMERMMNDDEKARKQEMIEKLWQASKCSLECDNETLGAYAGPVADYIIALEDSISVLQAQMEGLVERSLEHGNKIKELTTVEPMKLPMPELSSEVKLSLDMLERIKRLIN